jgi:hypothetical protein
LVQQPTFSIDIDTSAIEPIDILAILSGGIIESNLSPIPPNPPNYRGSYNTASKEILDIEIGMCRNTGIVTTTIALLLELTVCTGYSVCKK